LGVETDGLRVPIDLVGKSFLCDDEQGNQPLAIGFVSKIAGPNTPRVLQEIVDFVVMPGQEARTVRQVLQQGQDAISVFGRSQVRAQKSAGFVVEHSIANP
jgi:hypothetical protein